MIHIDNDAPPILLGLDRVLPEDQERGAQIAREVRRLRKEWNNHTSPYQHRWQVQERIDALWEEYDRLAARAALRDVVVS